VDIRADRLPAALETGRRRHRRRRPHGGAHAGLRHGLRLVGRRQTAGRVLTAELRAVEADGIDPRILGLYNGVPLIRRSASFGAPYADTIHLFSANLERVWATPAALAAQIRVAVLHETAHFLGYSESQLRSMGLA
jgi:hypothetical protein